MKSTRQTQPYRRSGSRAPSPALGAMLAGRSLGGHERLLSTPARGSAGARRVAIRVPLVTPLHKRIR